MIKKIVGAAAMAAMFVTLVGCGIPETPEAQPKTKEGLESMAKTMAEYTKKGEYKKFVEGTLWQSNEEAKESKIKELEKMKYQVEIVPNSGEVGYGGRPEVGTVGIKIKTGGRDVAGTWFFEHYEKSGWRLGS